MIGLFQGMFEKSILTFNPGRNQDAMPLASITNVRDLQRSLDTAGVALATRTDPEGRGPGHAS